MTEALRNIESIIQEMGVADVEIIQHPPVFTCEQADQFTPVPEAGLKSILVVTREKIHVVCVLLGAQRLDTKKVKGVLGCKVQFEKQEEAGILVGCETGAVPPFGHKSPFRTLVDPAVLQMDRVYFNPGVNTQTFGIRRDDFRKIMESQGAEWIGIAEEQASENKS